MTLEAIKPYEWSLSRSDSEAKDGFAYRQIYRLPFDQIETLMQGITRGLPYNGSTDALSPTLARWDLERDWHENPGYSSLTIFYKTPTWEDWLENNYSKGVLMVKGSTSSVRVRMVSGNVIDGQEPLDITGRSQWIITAGDNVVYKPRAMFRLYAVVHSSFLYRDVFMGHLGKANSNYMYGFGSANAPGALLFWGLDFQPRAYPSPRDGKPLYTAQYDFLYDEDGWTQPCVSRLFRMKGFRSDVIDDNGDVVDGAALHQVLVPSDVTQQNTLVQRYNFNGLDWLLQNSWTSLVPDNP